MFEINVNITDPLVNLVGRAIAEDAVLVVRNDAGTAVAVIMPVTVYNDCRLSIDATIPTIQ